MNPLSRTTLVVLLFSLASLGCDGTLSATSRSEHDNDPDRPDQPADTPIDRDMGGNMSGDGDMPAPTNTDMETPPLPPSDCGVTPIFEGLSPTCATCHRASNSPYFASAESFYNLVVSDPKWVTPGDSNASQLVALLEGRATGAYTQMPLGTQTFADLEALGQTSVTVAQVRQFIDDLDGCQRQDEEAPARPQVERKSARQILNALYQHLGLEQADVVRFTASRNYNDSRYPVHSPDDTKPYTNDPHIRPASQGPGLRWFALGGGSRLYNTRANRGFSPTFGQALTQTSQAWCGFAVDKENNTALFKHVQQDALADATDAQIELNLEYLMLRFWGHVATAEEVSALKTNVYDFYASEQNERTAWVAVCAALIRDPMWLSY